MGIDNYLCAKEDVENAAVPARDQGSFSFTNGMMKILERPQSTELRSYSARLQSLEEQKSDVVVSITDHESTLTVLENESASREKAAQEALEIKSQALAAKLDIKANHERVMRTNGLSLTEDEPVERPKPKKMDRTEPGLPWKARMRSFGVFVGIETLAFVASYVILRENLSDMEVYTRLIANGFVFFHHRLFAEEEGPYRPLSVPGHFHGAVRLHAVGATAGRISGHWQHNRGRCLGL